MAQDGKYGNIEIPGIRGDEPVFIIRAQDILAQEAVFEYGALAAERGASEEFVESVRRRESEIRDWQQAHPDSVKVPD